MINLKRTVSLISALCITVPCAYAEDITVGGYTQEELESTYYMDLDRGTAYPMVSDVYDISQIASGDAIKSKLNTLSHPYIIADNDDFERVKNLKETDPYIKKWYSEVEALGEKYLSATASSYKVSSGALSTNVDDASMVLAFLSNTCDDGTKKEAYTEKCLYYLKAAAEYPDFNPSKMLNVGEIARGVAVAYDWIYNYITPEDRTVISTALSEKALAPVLNSPNANSNNWNFVVNGGTLVAALAVGNDAPDTAASVICSNAAALPKAMRMYYPDGAFIEASGYYGYASGYLASTLAALNTAMGTDWGLSNIKGFEESGYFPIYTKGYNSEQAIAYGDGEMKSTSSPLMLWMAEKFDNTDFGMYQREEESNDLFSILWYNPDSYADARELSELPYDYCVEGAVPYASMRSNRTDTDGLFAGIKGGYNQMSHGDLDIGNFYIGAFGKSFTKELLGVDYHKSTDGLPSYFKLSRYTYYAKSPQGHNTLVINQPSHYPDMSFGQELSAYCSFSEYSSGENSSYAVLDMTSAYAGEVNSAYRGIKLDRVNDRIIVSDKISAKASSDVWWFMHTDADISVNGKKAELTIDGKTLYAEIISDTDAEFTIQEEAALEGTPYVEGFDDIMYTDGKKLAVSLSGVTEEELQICFSTAENNAGEFVSLDMWYCDSNNGYAMPLPQKSVEIKASDDTVANEHLPDEVRGGAAGVDIKNTGSSLYNREGYIKFKGTDISSSAEISRVTLTVNAIRNYRTPRQDETLSLYSVSGDWSEDTLTWNNKPSVSKENFIAEASVKAGNDTSVIDEDIVFDITDYYNSLEDKSVLAFAIKVTSENDGNVLLASRETGNEAVVEIRYTDTNYEIQIPGDYTDTVIAVCEKENGLPSDMRIYNPESPSVQIQASENTHVYVWSKNLEPVRFGIK